MAGTDEVGKMADILIDVFNTSDTDEVIDLALHFQNDGTSPPVTVDDQPDMLNIKEQYIDTGERIAISLC